MKKIQWFVVSAALAIGMSAPAMAAQSDPEVVIYRFPGVLDDGAATFAGIATLFHCTNFSGATENIRFVTRDAQGNLLSNGVVTITHLQTVTASTHAALLSGAQSLLDTGAVDHGTTAIAATSTSIICTAAALDAAFVKPQGIALRGIRFSPLPGSQE